METTSWRGGDAPPTQGRPSHFAPELCVLRNIRRTRFPPVQSGGLRHLVQQVGHDQHSPSPRCHRSHRLEQGLQGGVQLELGQQRAVQQYLEDASEDRPSSGSPPSPRWEAPTCYKS